MDTCTLYITNHLQLINEETGNRTTYSSTLKENNTSFHRASDHCIKITLQQRKQEMQTLPHEKLIIICRPELSSLNKRNELVSSCSHRGKALLRKNWTKFTATPIMQVRKVYKRWKTNRHNQNIAWLNPVQPNISMYFPHTLLFTFPMVLETRICLTLKSLLNWW